MISDRLTRVCRSDWVLDYEFEPHGRWRMGTHKRSWQPRAAATAHLYAPGVVYWEDTRHLRGPRHSAWVTFSGGEAVGLHRLASRTGGFLRLLDPVGRLGRLILETTTVGLDHGDRGFWRVQAVLCRILAMLPGARQVAADTLMIDAQDNDRQPTGMCVRVESYLRMHLAERLTLQQIADDLHMSRSNLVHGYRRAAGSTVMQTLMRLRIEQAQNLLVIGEPLKSAAAALGFADAFHLSRVFKRAQGCSPRTWRKRSASDSTDGDSA